MTMKGKVKPESTLRCPEGLHDDRTYRGAKLRERWLRNLQSVFVNELNLQEIKCDDLGYTSRHLVKRILRWARRTGYFVEFPTYKPRAKKRLPELVLMDRYAQNIDFRYLVDCLALILRHEAYKRQDVLDAVDLLGGTHGIKIWHAEKKLKTRVRAKGFNKAQYQKKLLTPQNGAVD